MKGRYPEPLRSGTICFDWALQADRLTCGDEMESYIYISENGESRGRQAELTSWLNISWDARFAIELADN